MKYSYLMLVVAMFGFLFPVNAHAGVYGGCAYGEGAYQDCVTSTSTPTSTSAKKTKPASETASPSPEAISPTSTPEIPFNSDDSFLNPEKNLNYWSIILILICIAVIIYLIRRRQLQTRAKSATNGINR